LAPTLRRDPHSQNSAILGPYPTLELQHELHKPFCLCVTFLISFDLRFIVDMQESTVQHVYTFSCMLKTVIFE
jgi:hypothetical protein